MKRSCSLSTPTSLRSEEEYIMNGFPWPPRSYSCSFCRREFKSAQALGGHMNVHRRERASLRQSSPTHTDLNLNLNPNCSTTSSLSFLQPPPSSTPSSNSCTTPKPVTSTLPLFVSPSTPPPSSSCILLSTKASEAMKPKFAESNFSGNIGKYDDFACEDAGCKMLKKAEILRMDLEICLPKSYDLDLELRLGTNCS